MSFGKRHLSCRVVFFKHKTFVNKQDSERAENLQLTRCSTDYIKNSENKCFNYQEIHNIESNPYDQEELKRCQTNSSSQCMLKAAEYYLTHSFLMHPFSTPWKHQKTVTFSDVFRWKRKGALGTNGLKQENSRFYKDARIINMPLSGPSHDVYSADIYCDHIYYHQPRYLKYTSTISTPSLYSVRLFDDIETLVLSDFSVSLPGKIYGTKMLN